jgi:hypothetical protein
MHPEPINPDKAVIELLLGNGLIIIILALQTSKILSAMMEQYATRYFHNFL